MRKIAVTVITLLMSVNIFAAGNDINSAIAKSLSNQNNGTRDQSTIIYGGKDISKPVIASANESLWGGQNKASS